MQREKNEQQLRNFFAKFIEEDVDSDVSVKARPPSNKKPPVVL